MDDQSPKPVIEIRTYRSVPGKRAQVVSLLERAKPIQRNLGMRIIGPFLSLDDEETLVWLRAFPSQAARESMREAYYNGPDWTGWLGAELMPLLEDYTSLLVEGDGVWEAWPDAPI